jgi:hypothetical protein
MNTESSSYMTHDARPQGSTCDGSSGDIAGDAIRPANTTRGKPLETPENIARAVHLAPTRSHRALHRVAAVLVALVVMCLVMAAIVWWRLLT